MNASQPSLNYVALKEVQGVMGDGSPLLVETFFTDSVKLLTAIQSALDEGNTDALRWAAHSFKGSAGNMSATALTALCHELEGLAFSSTTVGGGHLMTQLVDEYERVKTALEDI